MSTRHRTTTFFGALLLSALSTPVLGETIPEQGNGLNDGNSLVTSAQAVDISSGSVVIAGDLFFTFEFIAEPPPGMGIFHKDVDFYSFFASAGDRIVVDVDGGIGGAASIDTKIGIFGLAPDYPKLAENENADVVDEGSENLKDPYIDGFLVPADGIYTVAIAGMSAVFMDGGEVMGGAGGERGTGDYQLKLSGSTAPSAQVTIAITSKKFKKKGKKKNKVARIDLKKNKHIKVAILGSKHFPVSDIDASSLTFGAVGNEDTLRKCKYRTKDLNKDGEPDLECEFSLRGSGFSKHSHEGVLNGQTSDGRPFSGSDRVKVKGKLKGKG